uniref:Glycosyltransferase n=1 Tax=Pyramimonas orientalis virus TaxID=455367 RepID=A0A7M3UP73_POV01|nr:hypothetical protein HWQ62_00411 [Pyramimonas orientalis virus]
MTKVCDNNKNEKQYIPKTFFEPGLDCSNMLHVPEHRSGWNHVSECCETIHNPNGYLLVDFVEKIWGWNKTTEEEEKAISFGGKAYYVPYSEIKMINGMEYVVLGDEGFGVYWCGDEWVKSAFPIDVIREADTFGVISTPWVGIIHNPTKIPKWFDYDNSPQELMKNSNFHNSLTHCKGIIVFSEYLKQELLKLGGWPCTIEVLYHPTEPSLHKWNQFGQSKKIVQVGYWLRKISAIWTVDVPSEWNKYWINRADYGFTCLEREVFYENKLGDIINGQKIVQTLQLSNEEYDSFLSDAVIFLDLYDSSCNNAIIEAIVRHIPIIVNRIPATEEYLGKDYCLLFDDLSHVHMMLNNEELLFKAHKQLIHLEQSGKYYGNHFIDSLSRVPFLNRYQNIVTDTVISLGVDCLPRAMATKFHFKKSKANGELSCPFDLAWHDYETICRLLENDFEGYLDTTRLYINGNGHITHRDYSIVFNHESDNAEKTIEFAKNDYDLFCRRYSNRINNFKELLNTSEHVVFLLHYKDYPKELVSIIKRVFPELQFTILTINCPYEHETYYDQPTNIETVENNILFYTIKKPKANYLWYVDQDEKWESKIEDILKKHLNKYDDNCYLE